MDGSPQLEMGSRAAGRSKQWIGRAVWKTVLISLRWEIFGHMLM